LVEIDLHQLADQIMIDVIHGTLVCGAGILQPKGHDHIFEQFHSTRHSDEDINSDKGTTTPTKPAQAPPGPLTRARACELNFVMILKNEGPEAS
jgi:hypothetical protein